MKKVISFLLTTCLLLLLFVPVQATTEIDLYPLSRTDLKQFSNDVNSALKQYHTSLNSTEKDKVLSPVQNMVEDYIKKQGFTNPSWPWLDYTYTRQWDLLCVETRIDVKDANKKKQSIPVYGEVFPLGNETEVVYLKAADVELINRRDELPNPLWLSVNPHFINTRTGLDLTVQSKEELDSISKNIKTALSEHHNVDSKGERTVNSLVEDYVDDYFAQRGYTVSWPWLDYTYTCDWGLYTEKTAITCKDKDKKKHAYEIYAEVYKDVDQYNIIYLEIGKDTVIDLRNQVQGTSYQVYQKSLKYTQAQAYMAEERYSEAKDIFLGLGDFSNSQSMVYSCTEYLLGAEYAQAVALYDAGKYDEAKQAFLSLGNHADSAEQAQKCQDKLNEIQYQKAQGLMQDGHYDAAMPIFITLGDYADSNEQARLCFAAIQESQYQHACALRDQQLYTQAISVFTELGAYKDSVEQIGLCAEAHNQAQYDAALSAMKANQYADALIILTSLGSYKDAVTLASTCQTTLNEETYTHATSLMAGGHYDEAHDLFISLGTFSDSAEMAEKCLISKNNVDRKITFSETEFFIYLNKQVQLKPSVERLTENAPATSNVVYRSSDTSVIRVLKNGTINTVKEGTARVFCSTEDNPDNITEIIVHVVLPVSRVTLDRSEMKIQMDINQPSASAVALQAKVSPATAHDQSLTWTSSNEKVACVDANGLVTPVGPGSTTITATANDKTNGTRKATCTVRVTMAVSEIQFNQTAGTVFIGKTEKLKAVVLPENAANKQLTWSSSDKKVATVSSNGVVTGIASGTAIITAKASNGVEANYAVTVKQGPATFNLSVSATLISNDHVGNNWSKAFYVDDKKFTSSTTFTAEVGQTVRISGDITDNDSNPDYGYFLINLTMSEDIFKSGYTETKEVYVRENGGRYSGNRAEWRVVIKVRKR